MSTTNPGDRDDVRLARRWRQTPSPETALEIGNLLQAYALFTDHGHRDDLAALFTADATWDGTEIGYATASGPDAIADCVMAHFDPEKPMVHLPGQPLLVQVDDDHIEAFSWTLATRRSGGVTKPLIYFSYDDVMRRTPEGWLFRSRALKLRFRGD